MCSTFVTDIPTIHGYPSKRRNAKITVIKYLLY